MSSSGAIVEDVKVPLLDDLASTVQSNNGQDHDHQDQTLAWKVWIESKKLWHIVGPAIFSRITSYSMFVITQAFAGHLGDLELAAISISTNVIVGFDLGLLVLYIAYVFTNILLHVGQHPRFWFGF